MSQVLAIVYLACLVVAIVMACAGERRTKTYTVVCCVAAPVAILLSILTLA